MRLLDARPSLDPRNANYPIRPLLDAARPPRPYTWALGRPPLDQGNQGSCVGHAWAHELAARPRVVPVDSAAAFRIYDAARHVDEWPGADYSGTSVVAGAKAVRQLYPGRLTEYRWATTVDDAVRAIGSHGPVVLAVPWLDGMFTPAADGWITPSGQIAGWHAILANGINVRARSITLVNSWGDSWGRGGACRISWDSMQQLFALEAECCVPVRR